jgi:hypothetical protein
VCLSTILFKKKLFFLDVYVADRHGGTQQVNMTTATRKITC